MKEDRKAFNFFRSYYEAIESLPKTQKAKMYEAIVKYSFEDKYEPNFTGTMATIWLLLKPLLDKSFSKYLNKKGN